jgi:hypothetical protein
MNNQETQPPAVLKVATYDQNLSINWLILGGIITIAAVALASIVVAFTKKL